MHSPDSWNWEKGQRVISSSTGLPDGVSWIEEFHASPDGEKFAALAALEDEGYTFLVNGKPWDSVFDKAWLPKFSPDGRLTAIVQQDDAWTLAVDDATWEESYDYVWNTQFSTDGSVIATCIQTDGEYGMSVDGTPWETLYENMNQSVLASDGSASAGVVQLSPLKPADLDSFQDGVFGVAANGQAWAEKFLNAWTPVFDPTGRRVAAQVRLNLYEYTIAVDGKTWNTRYSCVWEPCFNPSTGTVVAPVLVSGRWGMAQDGQIIWEPKFFQCWHQTVSRNGRILAAIVAPEFGEFTVAVNAKPWSSKFPVVTDLVVSPEGECVAALGNECNTNWRVMVNDKVWDGSWDMAWRPVLSSGGKHVAVKVEKAGKQTVVIDGRVHDQEYDRVFQPVFSPDGNKLLIPAINKNDFLRIVIPVN